MEAEVNEECAGENETCRPVSHACPYGHQRGPDQEQREREHLRPSTAALLRDRFAALIFNIFDGLYYDLACAVTGLAHRPEVDASGSFALFALCRFVHKVS
jgi:hypothetical protein